jgi:dTDP-4-amino-4,6-dideoxygalactose transaminase
MTVKATQPGDAILAYYRDCLARHGDTARGAAWPNEVDRRTRFDTILDMLLSASADERIALCDLGCGSGELLSHIRERGLTMIDYVGVDRSVEALALARQKLPGVPFHCLDPLSASSAECSALDCDFLVANGLFTVKHTLTQEQMWHFTGGMLARVWPHVRLGIVFNVMSKQVDWEREDLFHVSFDEMAAFLQKMAGRRIGFRADYGLYEYMAYALKPPAVASAKASPTPEAIPVCRPLLPRAEAIGRYLATPDRSRRYSNHGPLVQQFEARLSRLLGHPSTVVVATSSGTSALVGAILATAGRAGDHRPYCLCPAHTFPGTASAIQQCGYRVHLTDVHPDTWALDPGGLAVHPLLEQCGLVVVVAPYGRCLPLARWQAFQERTGVPVVVDGAAAIESLLDHPELTVGRLPVVLSFHATKTFSTGEGGAIVCADTERLRRCMQALNFGFMGVRESRSAGTNGKMSEYHAAVALAELDGWPAKRAHYQRVALCYAEQARARRLGDYVMAAPLVASNYALFCARDGTEAAEAVAALDRAGVEHRRWYGLGLHREPYFATLPRDRLETSEQLAECLIGLPVAVDMPREAVARTVAALAGAVTCR